MHTGDRVVSHFSSALCYAITEEYVCQKCLDRSTLRFTEDTSVGKMYGLTSGVTFRRARYYCMYRFKIWSRIGTKQATPFLFNGPKFATTCDRPL